MSPPINFAQEVTLPEGRRDAINTLSQDTHTRGNLMNLQKTKRNPLKYLGFFLNHLQLFFFFFTCINVKIKFKFYSQKNIFLLFSWIKISEKE